MSTWTDDIPAFVPQKVQFPDGRSFEAIKPLNGYRSCHDGVPLEARIVFLCRETTKDSAGNEFVLKVKIQLPAPDQVPEQGPSTTTAAEILALEKFRDAKSTSAPHFIAFHRETQSEDGPLPGGFINYILMTKLPGFNLFGSYLSMSRDQQEEVVAKVVKALRSIYYMGIEPLDRGLRNILWDPETKYAGIVDFEVWKPTNSVFANETMEMQRWGLLKPPPAQDHFAAFNALYRSV